MTRFCFLYADDPDIAYNSSFWRCEVPAVFLANAGHQASLIPTMQVESVGDEWDVYIIEHQLFGPILAKALRWKAAGRRVWVTLDDNYWLIPKSIRSYRTWREATDQQGRPLGFDPLKDLERGLAQIDGAITPSRKLTDYVGGKMGEESSKSGRVRTIENYYPDFWLTFPDSRPEFDLGWSFNATHKASLACSGLKKALTRSGRTFFLNTSDHHLLDDCKHLYASYQPWVSQDSYLSVARRFRIGLAPYYGEYDAYRSNVKVLTYALAGRPWVASNSPAVQNAVGGVLVENTVKGWLQGIEAVEANYVQLQEAGLAWAKTYAISNHLGEYLSLGI